MFNGLALSIGSFGEGIVQAKSELGELVKSDTDLQAITKNRIGNKVSQNFSGTRNLITM